MPPEELAPPNATSAPTPRDRSMAVVWVVLAMVAVALGLFVWRAEGRREREGASHAVVGQRFPFAQLEPLTGGASPISAEQLRGKVTLLNFWGPWCEHCLREMPHLVRMREKFTDRSDVQFLFVSCGPDWEPNRPPALRWSEDLPLLQSSTTKLLAERDYDIPTYSDAHGNTRQAYAGLDGWDGYPTTLLLDRDGVIHFVSIGFSSGDEITIEEQLRQLLDSPAGERGA